MKFLGVNDPPIWPELEDKEILDHMGPNAPPIQVCVLERGMTSGAPSVTIRIDLADGRTLMTETSARLFCSASRMILAKYPNLFLGD